MMLALGVTQRDKRLAISGSALLALSYYLYRTYVGIDLGGDFGCAGHRNARELVFKDCPYLTDTHLTQLTKFSNLRAIRFENCPKITPQGLLTLRECPNLTHLELVGCHITRSAIDPDLIACLNANQHRLLEGRMGLFQCIKVENG